MAGTSVDSLMENLRHLIRFKIHLIGDDEKGQIECLLQELGFLRNFTHEWEDRSGQHEEELKNLLTRIRDLVSKVEDTVDSFVVDSSLKHSGTAEKLGHIVYPSLNTGDIREEIEAIRREIDRSEASSSSSTRRVASSIPLIEEEETTVVGFDDEAMMINEGLVEGTSHLDFISITGMAGQGKTTLASKVYNDPLNIYHFYIRAWVSISQESRKRDLVIGILSCGIGYMGGFSGVSDDNLGDQLYKCLKGKRYLIVIDDIWDISLWNQFKHFLPDDNNGSRVMITTRLTDVALGVKHNRLPHRLHFLTDGESWDLLRVKVFHEKIFLPNLMELGKKIAKRCQGLPLAIVVVAGILAKKENSLDFWEQVLEALSSREVGYPHQQCMDTLSLSYNHLPQHLKPCFLYFGAFPEDYEIPARKLIQLWVAEGFVAKIRHRSVEDVAEEYLMDLVGRNLVLVSSRRSDGGIKICRVHDLLRDFCLIRAKEECFLQQVSGHPKDFIGNLTLQFPEQIQFRFLTSHPHIQATPLRPKANMRRLSVHANILHCICLYPASINIRSFLCFTARCIRLPCGPVEFAYRAFKLLRVLDLCDIPMDLYPTDIEQLVLLRYLGLCVSFNYLPASISNLLDLETLVLSIFEFMTLPHTITQMVKLRHLCISGEGLFKIEGHDSFREEANDEGGYLLMYNLQTVSRLHSEFSQGFLSRTPNLKDLAFELDSCMVFPDLHHLNQLLKLRLSITARPSEFDCLTPRRLVKFPPNLKKLTLEKTYLNWSDISILEMLPNLEILKLLRDAFMGPCWKTKRGELAQLKYLKLQSLQIMDWNLASSHFPKLQHLMLVECKSLLELPSPLVDIPTLQTVELRLCSSFSQFSAIEIKEEQERIGNYWLKIIVNRNED